VSYFDSRGSSLRKPWTITEEEQPAAGCVIGRDYPEPVVDHELEREWERAMARYRAVSAQEQKIADGRVFGASSPSRDGARDPAADGWGHPGASARPY